MITLTINGETHQVDAAPDMPLLWVVRDLVGLKGTKFGCGVAQCGACTVLLNGTAQRSCVLPVSAVADQAITTIEGLDGKVADAVQTAWNDLAVAQCGYCQSGQVLAAVDLLSRDPRPDDAQITAHMTGNLCRCCTYHRIKQAVRRASDALV